MYMKKIICNFPLTTKCCCPVSSTSCNSELMQLQSLKLLRPTVYEKIQLHETARTNIRAHAWTDGRTDRQTQMDQLWYENNVPFFLQEKAGIKCLFYEYIFNI